MPTKDKICVKVYFNPITFAEIVKEAEASGKRRRGLQLYTQKKNGMAGEVLANTDGISKHLKFTADYYKNDKANQVKRQAEALRALEVAKKAAAEAGIVL